MPRASLASQLTARVSRPIRDKGEIAARGGKVELTAQDARNVRGRTGGAKGYLFDLRVTARGRAITLEVACSCPYFERERHLCEHLWAAIVIADERGALAEGHGATRVVATEPRDLDAGVDAPARPPPERAPARPPARAIWETIAAAVDRARPPAAPPAVLDSRPKRELRFEIDLRALQALGAPVHVKLVERGGPNSTWKTSKATTSMWRRASEHVRNVVRSMEPSAIGGPEPSREDDAPETSYPLRSDALDAVLLQLASGRRCVVREPADAVAAIGETSAFSPFTMDAGPPFSVLIRVEDHLHGARATAELRRDAESIPIATVHAIIAGRAALAGARAVRVANGDDVPLDWLDAMKSVVGCVLVAPTPADADALVRALLHTCEPGALELPPSRAMREIRVAPRVIVRLRAQAAGPFDRASSRPMRAEVAFDYDGLEVGWREPSPRAVDVAGRRFAIRDPLAERAALKQIASTGMHLAGSLTREDGIEIANARMAKAVDDLCAAGVHVEVEGVRHRRATGGSWTLASGPAIDWFELDGAVAFGDTSARLPSIFAALRRGDKTVELGDGSIGALPVVWTTRLSEVARYGVDHDGRLRFGRAQVTLVGAILDPGNEADGASRESVRWDASLDTLRQEMERGETLLPVSPPAGLEATLRPYQGTGVAWLRWLERQGLSGCLADEMGLGKTVQVLAFLVDRAAREGANAERRTSLVVAPRSVAHNWIDEAARFTPSLRVAEYPFASVGPAGGTASTFGEVDLVVTTYGMLLRNAEALARIPFDCVVLDEAHAIKNADAATTRAAYGLDARFRLAVTGTPVENHLGELASLFEFLNPGLLGPNVRRAVRQAAVLEHGTAQRLGRALRPMILRRKKADVLADLPPRIEQTIVCTLPPEQRRAYDELRDHYRDALLTRASAAGPGRETMHVLEALLRLRQLACHPGLIDPARAGEPSAKLETLLEHLAPLVAEGKKALVFSQFTSMLDLVSAALTEQGIVFERLDGATRDRRGRVARFQNDEQCQVFLVSLKAGGVGLNLTAAEYVFLLDPWWNPAAEAQAIDRAHRIGQTRTLVAYRLLARDTIEQRVAELQERKRGLMDSLFDEEPDAVGDMSRVSIGRLTADDLDALLR